MLVEVSRLDASLGICIPTEIAIRLGISEGSIVDVTAEGNRIIVSVGHLIYKLDELLVGMTPEAMHEALNQGPSEGFK